MIVFLDACVIIYLVEAAEPYCTALQKKLHDLRNRHGYFSFAASELSLLECRVKPMRDKNEIVLDQYQEFFTKKDLSLIPMKLSVIERATELRAAYNLKTPDALQAASALSISDSFLFVTNDATYFKKIPDLKVMGV